LELELDQYQMPELWPDIRQFTTEIATGGQVLRSVDSIMELRGMAALRSLFRDHVLRIEDIPRLCEHPATVAFRRWLWSKPDPRDAAALSRDFVGELSGRKSTTFGSYLARVVKVVGITIVQDVVLDAFGMPVAARRLADAGAALLSDCGSAALRGIAARAISRKPFCNAPRYIPRLQVAYRVLSASRSFVSSLTTQGYEAICARAHVDDRGFRRM
jgi:hypothetical protein